MCSQCVCDALCCRAIVNWAQAIRQIQTISDDPSNYGLAFHFRYPNRIHRVDVSIVVVDVFDANYANDSIDQIHAIIHFHCLTYDDLYACVGQEIL